MVELFDQATTSALIQAAGLALIAGISKAADMKRDMAKEQQNEDRTETKRWRESLMKRMDEQDRKIDLVVSAQATDMRSDIVHKVHRYLDDLGMASVEEKSVLKEQHKEYKKFCDANDIENDFLDAMVQRVMDLPERPEPTGAPRAMIDNSLDE